MKVYAMYKGDECLGIGTLIQLARDLKVKYRTLKFYLTPTYKKGQVRVRKGES